MQEVKYGDGSFADVVYHEGMLVVASQTDPRRDDTVIKVSGIDDIRLAGAGAAFPRLHSFNGVLYLGYRTGGRAFVRRLVDGQTSDLGPSGGNDPIAFGGAFVVWNDGTITNMWRRVITGGPVDVVGRAVGTGISHVSNTGVPTLVDDARFQFAGHTRPSWAGPYVVGELPDRGITLRRTDNGRQIVLWPNEAVFVPRIAVAPNGDIAVAAAGAGSVRIAIVRDDELKPAIFVPPPPPPPPPLEDEPLELSRENISVIEAFAARFGLPGLSKREGQEWVFKLAQTLRARFPHERWGTKQASPTRPPSNESVARYDERGRLWGWDLIRDAGAAHQTLQLGAHAEDISDQVYIDTPARDWLDGQDTGGNDGGNNTLPPPPPPPPPPTTCRFVAPLVADLTPISDSLEALASTLGSLDGFLRHELMGKLLEIDNKLNQLVDRPAPTKCVLRR